MKILILIGIALLCFSCEKTQTDQKKVVLPEQEWGSRVFNFDDTKIAFKISLSGVSMGAPDSQAVWSVIEAAQLNGLIDHRIEVGLMYEGWISECIQVQNIVNRKQLQENLKNVPTSLLQTYYLIQSVTKYQVISTFYKFNQYNGQNILL